MDADAILALQAKLGQFLRLFSHCGCSEVLARVATYVEGQLTDLERKNVEQMALNAGVAPRTLQEFLSSYGWDQLPQIVAREHAGDLNIGIISLRRSPVSRLSDERLSW